MSDPTAVSELVQFQSGARGVAPGDLRVTGLRGEERLGAPYRLELELITRRADLDPDALLYAPARVGLRDDDAWRWLGGALTALTLAAEPDPHGWRRLSVVLEPRLAALRGARRSRVLRDLSGLDLARKLLAEAGLLDGPDLRCEPELLEQARRTPPRTRACLPVHDLLTQEQETDLDFLLRHLEREGIALWFEPNEAGAERVVLGERPPLTGAAPLALTRVREARLRLPSAVSVIPGGQPGVEGLGTRAVRPGGAPPRVELDALFQTESQARHLAGVRAEELLARAVRWTGVAAPGTGPLRAVSAPRLPASAALRVVAATHQVAQDFAPDGACLRAAGETVVEALRAELPFRPARLTAWPATADLGAVLAQGVLRARAAAPAPAGLAHLPGETSLPGKVAPAPEPALAGAGPLPGPGLGMPEADSDDDTRDLGAGETDNRALWDAFQTAYGGVVGTPVATAAHVPVRSKEQMQDALTSVLADGESFEAFENRATVFEGAYGGGYSVSMGDSAELTVGNQGSYAEGKQSKEVAKFERIYEDTEATRVESTSLVKETMERLEGHWSESVTKLTQYVKETTSVGREIVSNTNVGGDIVENTNVGGTLTGNTNVGGILSDTTNATSALIVENVGINTVNSIYGATSEATTAGLIQEQTNAGVIIAATVAGMVNEAVTAGMVNNQNIVAFTNEVTVGDRIGVLGGNAVEINLGPTKMDIFLGLALDVAVGLALGVFGGVKLDIVIGGTGEIVIGENFSMILGHQTDMGIGAITKIYMNDTGTGLTRKNMALKDDLGG